MVLHTPDSTLCIAAAAYERKVRGSLSFLSKETQAMDLFCLDSHEVTRVVLPEPAGAVTSMSRQLRQASSFWWRRDRVTRLSLVEGMNSLVVSRGSVAVSVIRIYRLLSWYYFPNLKDGIIVYVGSGSIR